MIGLFTPLIMRIVRLAKAQNITSIADFIAARYGKGQAVAATVALIAIVGTIPYIALQLKAVSTSLETIIAHISPGSSMTPPVLGDIALFVALSMAIFAVLFGTRHIDATEHQDGLMLAIAAESLVKLFAFLAVGIFVTFWMFGGPGALFTQARSRRDTAAICSRAIRPSRRWSPSRCCRSWRSSCCRGNSTSRWWRTTAKARSSAPPGCFRSIWC